MLDEKYNYTNSKCLLKNLIFKLESFSNLIRWKAYFFEKPNEIDDVTVVNNFGFESVLTPPKNEHLNAFEDDICNLVRNIEFKRANTVFQNQLNKDIKMINKGLLLFFPADKSNHLYKINRTAIANYCKTTSQNCTKNLTSL